MPSVISQRLGFVNLLCHTIPNQAAVPGNLDGSLLPVNLTAQRGAYKSASREESCQVRRSEVFGRLHLDQAADRTLELEPEAVPEDRKGIAESIRRRMERHGGRATIRSSPDGGTEVTLEQEVR